MFNRKVTWHDQWTAKRWQAVDEWVAEVCEGKLDLATSFLVGTKKNKQGLAIEVGASQSVEVDADPRVVVVNVTNIKFNIIKFTSLSYEVSLVMWLINVVETRLYTYDDHCLKIWRSEIESQG